jgi:hypothetical protein
MESEIQFFKINQQCIQNLADINVALNSIETKGESTMIMYKVRLMLSASLEQIQKDNQPEDIVNKEKEDKK